MCFNVKADMCKYDINGEEYLLQFSLNSFARNWRYAYNFSNEYLYSSSSGSISSKKMFSPNDKNNKIFSEFENFGYSALPGVCPVLVDIGNGYTVIPYSSYVDYFDFNVICKDCTNNVVKVKNTWGINSDYTFDKICAKFKDGVRSYTATNRAWTDIDVPFLGYVYLRNGSLVSACSNSSMARGTTLYDYLKEYSSSFIVGESFISDENSCPLYDAKNNYSEILDCLDGKAKDIDLAMDSFVNACSENEMRTIQSYASGTISKFHDKGSVSAYLNNEVKLLFSSFSDECGSAADSLYSKINNLGIVLYSYSSIDAFTKKLAYMYFESKYLSAYSLLTSINTSIKVEEDSCKLISDGAIDIVLDIVNAFKIGAVVIVIFLSIVEIYKAFVAGDDSSRKKLPSLIVKRIALLFLILLLPVIISIILDYLNKFISIESSKCVVDKIS